MAGWVVMPRGRGSGYFKAFAQKKSGLVIYPPGNPAEPERIVKTLGDSVSVACPSCFH
jgi:hypothetical protein